LGNWGKGVIEYTSHFGLEFREIQEKRLRTDPDTHRTIQRNAAQPRTRAQLNTTHCNALWQLVIRSMLPFIGLEGRAILPFYPGKLRFR
jgi:hypothetical protein